MSCIAAQLNAILNGVDIETSSSNLLVKFEDQIETPPDVILVGDLCYDTEFSTILFEYLLRMRRKYEADIYVGDPGRHGLTNGILKHLQPLQKYELTESGKEENHGFGVVNVFRFK